MLTARFYGVRGSTPCSCDDTRRFGGNTSCVLVSVPGERPIIIDLGTGLRYLGADLLSGAVPSGGDSFMGTALVSHLHWDHIQGTPFFRPLLTAGASLEIIGPRQVDGSIAEAFRSCICPPVFPVPIDLLPGSISFRDVSNERFAIGSATVTAFDVPHVGPTNGYRIDVGTASLAYVSDHQQPMDGSLDVPDEVVEACAGVDILVHDAQYSNEEFAKRTDWGHCTPEFALALALGCGARRLVLFHHDPAHDDAWVQATVERIQDAAGHACQVLGGAEGLTLISGC
ncbi:MAG: MBL fold metallo-hydrolase [Acidimicrobiales bacterium]